MQNARNNPTRCRPDPMKSLPLSTTINLLMAFLVIGTTLITATISHGSRTFHTITPTSASFYGIYSAFPVPRNSTSTITVNLANDADVRIMDLDYCILHLRDWRTNQRIQHDQMNKRIPLLGNINQFSTNVKLNSLVSDSIIIIDITVFFNLPENDHSTKNNGHQLRHQIQSIPTHTSFLFGNTTMPVQFASNLILNPFSVGQSFLSNSPRVKLQGDYHIYVQPQIFLTNLQTTPSLSHIRLTPTSRFTYRRETNFISSPRSQWDNDPKCTINNAEVKGKIDWNPSPAATLSTSSLLLPVDAQLRSSLITGGTLAIMCNTDLSLEPSTFSDGWDELDLDAFSTHFFEQIYLTIDLLDSNFQPTGLSSTLLTATSKDYHQPVTLAFGFMDPSSVLCQLTVSYDGYKRLKSEDEIGFLFPHFTDLKGRDSLRLGIKIADASDQTIRQLDGIIEYHEIPSKINIGQYSYKGYAIPLQSLGIDQDLLDDQTLIDIQYELDLSKVSMNNSNDFQCNMIFFHTSPEAIKTSATFFVSDRFGNKRQVPEILEQGGYYFTTGSPLQM